MLRTGMAAAVCVLYCACLDATQGSIEPENPYDDINGLTSPLGDDDEEKNDFKERKTSAKEFKKRKDACARDPRVMLNLVSAGVCTGADLFFREPFGGNGRACGSCHAAQFNYTISPQFLASLPPSDPLFVAETNPTLAELEIPELMRGFGLILENVDGAEDPTNKFVMRSVPHTFSLATSLSPAPVTNPDGTGIDGTTQPPLQRTGWSGDGAPNPGGLKQFQLGAINQHYTKSLSRISGTDFTLPSDEQLTDIENFLLVIGRTKEVPIANVVLTDLNADQGRKTFIAARCNGCHVNAGANVNAAVGGFNRNFDTGVENARPTVLNDMGIMHDGGFGGGAPGAPFNHDVNNDGIADSFGNGGFNTPPLIEAADTGPFFHNNASATLEDAIRFYQSAAFIGAPNGVTPITFNDTEVRNVGKFLRVMNASLNDQIAIKRLQAVIAIVDQFKNRKRGVQFGLLDATQAEVRDAITVLSQVGASSGSVNHLRLADTALTKAQDKNNAQKRRDQAQIALNEVLAAESGLGTGLDMAVGQGSLMF